MKHLFITLSLLSASILLAPAQVLNYAKLKVPTVDGGGVVFDAKGNKLGKVNHDGEIFDASGNRIAKFDVFKNIIEDGTETNFGKEDANGNFMAVVNKKVVSWKLSPPENQGLVICLIKDKSGEIVATVNKVFKEYGTGAVYYLTQKNAPAPPKEEAKEAKQETQATAKPAKSTEKKKAVAKKPTPAPAKKKSATPAKKTEDKKKTSSAKKSTEKKK